MIKVSRVIGVIRVIRVIAVSAVIGGKWDGWGKWDDWMIGVMGMVRVIWGYLLTTHQISEQSVQPFPSCGIGAHLHVCTCTRADVPYRRLFQDT